MTQPLPRNVRSRPRPSAPVARSSAVEATASSKAAFGQVRPREDDSAAAAAAAGHDATAESEAAATEALIRRVLCPPPATDRRRPLDELLPPLTSSNAIDLQLYALLAVVVKEFVYSWYARLTPDRTFVAEVVNVVAHCTRDLEQRARRVDWESVLLDEIPALVSRHVFAYRTATSPLYGRSEGSSSSRTMYATLLPHPAFAPAPIDPATAEAQAQNEAAYRQLLAQAALAVLLPAEDLRDPCLRTLVADVLADLILGQAVGRRACAPWLIWEGIANAAEKARAKVAPAASGEEIKERAKSRLRRFSLSSPTKASREKDPSQAAGVPVAPGAQSQSVQKPSAQATGWARASLLTELFWRTLQYLYLAAAAMRFVVEGLAAAAAAPPRDRRAPGAEAGEAVSEGRASAAPARSSARRRPILTYAVFGLGSQLLELPERMPWTAGLLALGRHHLVGGALRLGARDGLLDKFLHALLARHLFSAAHVPGLLRLVRATVFPRDALGPPRAVPGPAEQRRLRRRAARALLDATPPRVARRLFCAPAAAADDDADAVPGAAPPDVTVDPDPAREQALRALETGLLDVWSDEHLNRRLAFAAVELVLVRLMPELAEKATRELLEEKIGPGAWADWDEPAVPS